MTKMRKEIAASEPIQKAAAELESLGFGKKWKLIKLLERTQGNVEIVKKFLEAKRNLKAAQAKNHQEERKMKLEQKMQKIHAKLQQLNISAPAATTGPTVAISAQPSIVSSSPVVGAAGIESESIAKVGTPVIQYEEENKWAKRWRLKQEKKEEKRRNKEYKKEEKAMKKGGKRFHKNSGSEDEERVETYNLLSGVWPQQATSVYLDGNNMMFVLSSLRTLILKRKNMKSAEAALEKIALKFCEVMNFTGELMFDETNRLSSFSNLSTTSARPAHPSTDDAFVAFAQKLTNATVFVTSDRELMRRLKEAGKEKVIICKPKSWFQFVANTLNGGEEVKELDSFYSAWVPEAN